MSAMPEPGSPAPDFTLPRDGGGTVSLHDFRGKIVVLYFYPKDDTTGCTKEAIGFSERIKDFSKAGAVVIGVSKDSAQKHDKFKAKHDLKVILAADENLDVNKAYGVWVEKSMYGRRYMGTQRATFLIDANGKVVRVWPKVKLKDHVSEVLEAVKELAGRSAKNPA